MKAHNIAIALMLVVCLLNVEMVAAQQTKQQISETWQAVQSLDTGADVIIKLADGKTVKGNYVEAHDTILTLSKGDRLINLSQSNIRKVYLFVKRKKDTQEAIGTLAGAGTGVALGLATGSEDGDPVVLGVVISAIIFAGIGYGLARWFTPKHKKILIYESSKS
ncbi:MAG: hypothetical protein AB1757_18265 [Acidobacteriota bacterium]